MSQGRPLYTLTCEVALVLGRPSVRRTPDVAQQSTTLRESNVPMFETVPVRGHSGTTQDADRTPRVRASRLPPLTPAGSALASSGLGAPVVGMGKRVRAVDPGCPGFLGRAIADSRAMAVPTSLCMPVHR
jgi:hypothetical protein